MSEIIERGRLVWRLIFDERVPVWVRYGIPLVVVLYLLSPIDLIPDFILGLGQVDDIGLVLLALGLIIRFAPDYVVREHERALGYSADTTTTKRPEGGEPTRRLTPDVSIDGEYEVVNPHDNDGKSL